MPLTSSHLRRWADELDAEEKEAQKELESAETAEERKALRAELDELKSTHADVLDQLAKLTESNGRQEAEPEPEPEPDPEPDERKHYRPGRKRGQVYQEEPGGAGVIWQGDDEPDRVEIDEEGNDV